MFRSRRHRDRGAYIAHLVERVGHHVPICITSKDVRKAQSAAPSLRSTNRIHGTTTVGEQLYILLLSNRFKYFYSLVMNVFHTITPSHVGCLNDASVCHDLINHINSTFSPGGGAKMQLLVLVEPHSKVFLGTREYPANHKSSAKNVSGTICACEVSTKCIAQ